MDAKVKAARSKMFPQKKGFVGSDWGEAIDCTIAEMVHEHKADQLSVNSSLFIGVREDDRLELIAQSNRGRGFRALIPKAIEADTWERVTAAGLPVVPATYGQFRFARGEDGSRLRSDVPVPFAKTGIVEAISNATGLEQDFIRDKFKDRFMAYAAAMDVRMGDDEETYSLKMNDDGTALAVAWLEDDGNDLLIIGGMFESLADSPEAEPEIRFQHFSKRYRHSSKMGQLVMDRAEQQLNSLLEDVAVKAERYKETGLYAYIPFPAKDHDNDIEMSH